MNEYQNYIKKKPILLKNQAHKKGIYMLAGFPGMQTRICIQI